MAREPSKITAFGDLSSEYGIKDLINLEFVHEIQDLQRKRNAEKGKEKKKEMLDEIVAKCEALEENLGMKIFNPFLLAAGEFSFGAYPLNIKMKL